MVGEGSICRVLYCAIGAPSLSGVPVDLQAASDPSGHTSFAKDQDVLLQGPH